MGGGSREGRKGCEDAELLQKVTEGTEWVRIWNR